MAPNEETPRLQQRREADVQLSLLSLQCPFHLRRITRLFLHRSSFGIKTTFPGENYTLLQTYAYIYLYIYRYIYIYVYICTNDLTTESQMFLSMFFFYGVLFYFILFFDSALLTVTFPTTFTHPRVFSDGRRCKKLTAGHIIFDRNCQIHLQPVSCSEQMSGFNLRCLHWSTEKRKRKKKRTIFSCPSRPACQRCSYLRHWVTWCILLLWMILHSDSRLAQISLALPVTLKGWCGHF